MGVLLGLSFLNMFDHELNLEKMVLVVSLDNIFGFRMEVV